MHPRIVELELWLPALSDHAPLEGKDVAARCQGETGLPSDVVLGLSFVPSEHDVGTLKRAVETGEVELEEFRKFCQKRGLPANPEDTRSAAEFVAFTHGQPLAWLHLPAESSGLAMARTAARWANLNNLQVRDGASTYELLSDEQLCSLWQGAA